MAFAGSWLHFAGALSKPARELCASVEKNGGKCSMHVGRHLSHLVVGVRPEKSKIKAALEAEVQLVSESWMEAVLRAGSVAAVDVGLHAPEKISVPDRGTESTKRARVSERSVASGVSDSVAAESAPAMKVETAISDPDRGIESTKRARVSERSVASGASDSVAVESAPTVKVETATSDPDREIEYTKRARVSERSVACGASDSVAVESAPTVKVETAVSDPDSSVEHPKHSRVSEASSVSFASLGPSTGTTATVKVERGTPDFFSGPPAFTSRAHATVKVERATPDFLSGPPAITSRRPGEPGTSIGTTATVKVERATPDFCSGPPAFTSTLHGGSGTSVSSASRPVRSAHDRTPEFELMSSRRVPALDARKPGSSMSRPSSDASDSSPDPDPAAARRDTVKGAETGCRSGERTSVAMVASTAPRPKRTTPVTVYVPKSSRPVGELIAVVQSKRVLRATTAAPVP